MPPEPPPDAANGDSLSPRWIWIAFAVLALVIPMIGLFLEARR